MYDVTKWAVDRVGVWGGMGDWNDVRKRHCRARIYTQREGGGGGEGKYTNTLT